MMVVFFCYYLILFTWLCSINDSLHTLNHYTIYYESWRYEFQEKQLNDSIISIIDPYNNTITLSFSLNTSFIITINNSTTIDYFDDNDWNEIHHLQSNSHMMHLSHRRRLFLGFVKKGVSWLKKRIKRFLRRRFGKIAIPPPRNRRYWRKKWIKKGRYIGYFPGYGKQRGFTYKEAETYCDEHFGGLATVFSAAENKQVFGICRELLKKYKRKAQCKRRCRHIPYRGTKCWNECKTPSVEYLYEKKHWKGHNCWIGLQLGASESRDQFTRWNDMHKVHYRNWSPGEPSYRTIKRCKRITGSEEKQCETERRYDEQCGEILGWKAGTKKVKRSAKQRQFFKGIPASIQNQIAPQATSKLVTIQLAGKWNNARCKANRVAICQRPRGQVYDKYIVVRAKRSYSMAAQFCANWYGTTLATIVTDEDQVRAMEACQKVDIHRRSCWIGLKRPFKQWDDATDTQSFENWAKGEPNNAGYDEDCVELYGGNGKWNDLACNAKRYFVCNLEAALQRMDPKVMRKMILKRFARHQAVWSRYRRNEYRAKIRKQYMKKMRLYMLRMQKQKRYQAQRRRDSFRQNIFNQQYGGFATKLSRGYKRRMVVAQNVIDERHDAMERKEVLNEEEDDEIDRKCRVLNGLYLFCIDGDGVEIRKYIKNEPKIYDSAYKILSNHTMSFMKYEDVKYESLMMKNSDNRTNVVQFDSYYVKKSTFEYDGDSNHRRQCLKYLEQLQLCLELKDDEMMIEISKSKQIHFSIDAEWNEIDVLYQENRNIQKRTKCVHIFDAKVCVECTLRINNDNDYVPLSYVAIVLMQEV